MKILAQNYSNGDLELLEVPMFTEIKGLLVETKASLVSVGTEKAMIDIAKKNIIGKAIARPDWVRQVIDKVKTDGLMEAWRQSKARLDMPVPLGYSCSGILKDVGTRDGDFRIGTRVACAGSGYASHAEFNLVPPNLCVKIPDNVSFEDAAYVAVGGIAMEAVRLAKVEFGHKIGVIGLGLLGQLTVQILRSAGCHIIGIDISEKKCELALKHGAEVIAVDGKDDPISRSMAFANDEGLDAVIIMASFDSNKPLIDAAEMCRERGRIVACGLVGLNIPRETFYKKELDFAVSRAWGPGMYDPDYEERGLKYPLAYARWTALRNMEEFLKMVSLGTIKLDDITTHIFSFDRALEAYEMILSGKEPAIGVVLRYNEKSEGKNKKSGVKILSNIAIQRNNINEKKSIGIGLIGAGLFARGTLLPAMQRIKKLSFEGVATARGLTGQHIAKSFDFKYCTTDYLDILNDKNIDIVFILTRHNSHAKFICEALKAGKAIFVEKPLCINEEQLKEIVNTYSLVASNNLSTPFLTVGFNRRFAPTTKKCVEFVGQNGKNAIVQIRCNAGYIPPESWVHKREEGGGRIIGEVCHFVDLADAITDGVPKKVFASALKDNYGLKDNLTISIQMDNGAVAGITYASNGDKSFPREEVQVFAGGAICIIENFKNITFVSSGKKRIQKSIEANRGYKEQIETVVEALIAGMPSPIDFKPLVAATVTTFAIEESIKIGKAVDINLDEWFAK
ncbi:MAG: hypothetical protein A2X55_05015 [Nitrospirae bacterium GWB2_47_37]|nr:MAG: hypothetical protein A2X55_05015 [Nitrospirae bacterium GWB2_47_37]